MQSDTPRTDAECDKPGLGTSIKSEIVGAHFARTLERELNAANKEIEGLHDTITIKNKDIISLTTKVHALRGVLIEISKGIGSSHAADKANEALIWSTIPKKH